MSVRKSFDFILCIGGCHCEIILRCLSSATGNIGSKLGQDRNIRSLHSLTHPLTNPESKCGYASHRRQKPQKKESSFLVFCLHHWWLKLRPDIITMAWRCASPWSFHRSLRRIRETHIFRYFSRLLKCWSKNNQTNNKTRKPLNTRKR